MQNRDKNDNGKRFFWKRIRKIKDGQSEYWNEIMKKCWQWKSKYWKSWKWGINWNYFTREEDLWHSKEKTRILKEKQKWQSKIYLQVSEYFPPQSELIWCYFSISTSYYQSTVLCLLKLLFWIIYHSDFCILKFLILQSLS